MDELRALLEPVIGPIIRAAISEAMEELEPRDPPREILDRRGCADLLGCSIAQVDRLTREHALPMRRCGDSPRYLRADVLEWLRGRGT